MSKEEQLSTMEALKALPEKDKNFVLGYAAGVIAAKAEQPQGGETQKPA